MDLKECYAKMGGDYEAVLQRLRMDKLIEKFMLKFPADDNYAQLTEALAAKDWGTAFRAAHTLKGVGLNLGFTTLGHDASELTEALRSGEPAVDIAPLVDKVKADYELVMSTIAEYQAANG